MTAIRCRAKRLCWKRQVGLLRQFQNSRPGSGAGILTNSFELSSPVYLAPIFCFYFSWYSQTLFCASHFYSILIFCILLSSVLAKSFIIYLSIFSFLSFAFFVFWKKVRATKYRHSSACLAQSFFAYSLPLEYVSAWSLRTAPIPAHDTFDIVLRLMIIKRNPACNLSDLFSYPP